MKKTFSLLCISIIAVFTSSVIAQHVVKSPDKNLSVKIWLGPAGNAVYSIHNKKVTVLEESKLGLVRNDENFSANLSFVSASPVYPVSERYELLTSKSRLNEYHANKQVFRLRSQKGQLLDIIFQVSNDGVAFRYFFPESSGEIKKISEELTSFNFKADATAWLQPMSDAKTGWEKVHPSYEEYYQQNIPVGTPSPIKAGWVYPALFKTGKNWVLITETFPNGDYCGTRLKAESPGGEYKVGFPQPEEVFPGGALNPESKSPWYSPWRIITVGSLKAITESTLGTDLAAPAAVKLDAAVIKPGKSSWSWAILKDNSILYDVQKRFIDYAADMRWEYCLIDVNWDTRIGYDKIKELADYAKTKNVGLILWYNSAGSWNSTPYHPKSALLTHEQRVREFKRIQDIGIKGIKVDFFGGDGQSMMNYYIDILKDAAAHNLLVNCHGSTLPRGLQRTYPNLVSMEAIKGFEFATFEQANQDVQPGHCTILPFTRNAFDPMDYTPMVLHEIPNIKRKTSNGFELALPILFLSGVQHLAETPEGMKQVPEYVKDHLRNLPAYWDEVKFIEGFPGKSVVIARRSGSKWYVAGINGQASESRMDLDLSFLKKYRGTIITDGDAPFSFEQRPIAASRKTSLRVKPAGGFVMVFNEK
ncbi:glycoside hydrolase family 97 catalytic domain-containing protein [Paradesertivirga mongoliensis]|uniref:Glycoside hydrolase family 97 catalytic domain-containing protein n=1 Tax=Paradesertivirga mongoliensis TaxID=2100740 RepID=A0ABW4ZH29_9SPHI|nr:glycoside hydrolase family 97 protein [Pedobacter mongoliensis]